MSGIPHAQERAFSAHRQKHLAGFTRELFLREFVKRIIFSSTVCNVFGGSGSLLHSLSPLSSPYCEQSRGKRLSQGPPSLFPSLLCRRLAGAEGLYVGEWRRWSLSQSVDRYFPLVCLPPPHSLSIQPRKRRMRVSKRGTILIRRAVVHECASKFICEYGVIMGFGFNLFHIISAR